MDTLVGRRLGKYQIETLIGRGGMAAVYRAHDTALNRSVAIKVLEPALAIDPKAVERFKREAVTAANLEHPSIVRVYDVEQAGTLHYIAMRYVQGTTLRDILRDNGALPLDIVARIIEPIAAALHYAHAHGVIHRDVKPGNILVEPDGTVLLTDFGIARAADNAQSSLTAVGHVMGTADYLAPEQISGRPAEPRSDVYSLGVVLYEMLTGKPPFAGESTATVLYRQVHEKPPSLRQINPRLPSDLQPIMDRVLSKNPAVRYADPLDLARDLTAVAQWHPAGTPMPGPIRKTQQSTVTQPRTGNTGGNRYPGTNGSRKPTGPIGQATVQPNISTTQLNGQKPEIRTQRSEMLTPPRDASRVLSVVVALVLLLGGTVILVIATGLFMNKAGGETVRFKAAGPSSYAGPTRTENGPDLHIPQALIPPIIDGDLSDWAGAGSPFQAPDITFKNGRDRSGPDDLSAGFYLAWDATNFYVAATITDNVHVQFARTRGYDLYKGDDIELWFDTDLAGDFAVSEANGDDYQLGLSPGDFAGLGPEAVFWNPDRSDQRNAMVRVAAKPRTTDSGYVLEAAVPWAALGSFRPQPGMAIGFAASAGDNDQRGVPIQELMTSTGPRLQYHQPYTFGNLFF